MNDWDEMLGELGSIPDLPGARCAGRWELFDHTISGNDHATVEYARAAALQLCDQCPARSACAAWLETIPHQQRPRGVIAGRINERTTA